jgi:uncharacterized protein YlaI
MPRMCQRCKKRECRTGHWCNRCKKWQSERSKKMHATVGDSYAKRNRVLKSLGFASYSDYLRSDLWDNIRFQVFVTKGTKCSLCDADANQVHHNRYAKQDMLGNTLEYLHPMCGECHKRIEFSKKRKKLKLKDARNKFKQIQDNPHGLCIITGSCLEPTVQAPPEFVQSQ